MKREINNLMFKYIFGPYKFSKFWFYSLRNYFFGLDPNISKKFGFNLFFLFSGFDPIISKNFSFSPYLNKESVT